MSDDGWETITPDKAIEYLHTSVHDDLEVNLARVGQFATQMRAGLWVKTKHPIVFNKEGRLIDGVHRLYAVAMAEVPIDMLVVRDFTMPDITIEEIKSEHGDEVGND